MTITVQARGAGAAAGPRPAPWLSHRETNQPATVRRCAPGPCLSVLIADGDVSARQRLRSLLAETRGVRCVGHVALGSAVTAAVVELQPDVVFLGARLSGLSGLDVLPHLSTRTATIVTAPTGDHAARALDLGALDYLVTPIQPDRVIKALSRARAHLWDRGVETAGGGPARSVPCFRRLFVQDGDVTVPLLAAAVERIEAADDAVFVVASGKTYVMTVPLQWIERRLEPRTFVRVHRSHIVNLDHVVSWVPYGESRIRITFRSGATLLTSRQRSTVLRMWGR
jgi:two-component system, LytTR family, response regulator